MSPDQFLNYLTGIIHRHIAIDGDDLPECRWWHRAAMEAWQKRWVQLIMSRDGSELYLARFWLHQPRRQVRGDPVSDGATWDSGDSSMVHFFARGDDDQALHDHPWHEFRSEVLIGGYSERRPPPIWRGQCEAYAELGGIPGCAWDEHEITVRTSDSGPMTRSGRNQHAVEDVIPGTWTHVVTGLRVRQWGFHPAGRSWLPTWLPNDVFLAEALDRASVKATA